MLKISSIPSTYKNINMRSILETRWVAFFDLCGWTWEYESITSFRWIPDFVIRGNSHPIYVEVRAYSYYRDWLEEIIPKSSKNFPKLECEECLFHDSSPFLVRDGSMEKYKHINSCDKRIVWQKSIPTILLLGAGMMEGDVLDECMSITNKTDFIWGSAKFFKHPNFDTPDIYCGRPYNKCYNYRSFINDIIYEHENRLQEKYFFTDNQHDLDLFRRLWAEAGNITQWKKK